MKKIYFTLLILIPVFCFTEINFHVVKIDSSSLPEVKIFVKLLEKGKTLPRYNENDFSLLFNGQKTGFKFKVRKSKIGISTLILIDASFSINKRTRTKLHASAKTIISKMRPQDQCALFIFHDKLLMLSDFTRDKNKLFKLIHSYKPAGKYTRLYDAINKSESYINEKIKGGRKAILIFSDGFDEQSKITRAQAIKVAKEGRIPIFTIGYTNINKKHLNNLKVFSAETGAMYSYENEKNIFAELFPPSQEDFYVFTFNIKKAKKTNYITLKNEKLNKSVRVKLVLDKKEIEKVKENENKSRIIYTIIILVIILLLLLFAFFIYKFFRKKIKQKSGDKKSSILKSEKEKQEALKHKKLELDDEAKWLVTKSVLSQINNERPSTITFYKDFFQKEKIDAKEFNKFTDTVEEFYNTTSSLTFSEVKKLEKIINSFREITGKKNFTTTLDEFIVEDKLEKIKTTLIHKKVTGTDDVPKRITDMVPMLKDIFTVFESETNKIKPRSIDEIFDEYSDEDFNMIIETLLLGNSFGEADLLIRDIFELDDEKIAQLIPFMITVVKDSEGFERDVNEKILKRMAQSLNLNIDNLTDVSDFEDWWKKNKKEIIEKAISKKYKTEKIELPNGFFVNEELLMYSNFNDELVEFSGTIQQGDKYSISLVSNQKLYLDSIVCFYRPDLPFSDNALRINEYTFTRLVEVSKVEKDLFNLNIYFVHPNHRTGNDIKRISNLLFKE